MKIFSVIGARPQFIKAAMVSRQLAALGQQERLIHTGQHFDPEMSAIFFEQLGLPEPAYYLGIGGTSHGAMTGRMLEALEAVFLTEKPDWVLVYGDTNSTLAAALAAVKLQIPLAHVEAGMRSFNRAMPEEINRVLVDHVSELLFVTGQEPVRLLAAEGISRGIHCVGDVMYDAVLTFLPAARQSGIRAQLQLEGQAFGLVTLHRAENTDEPARLRIWLKELENLSRHLQLVFPVHPRTRKAIAQILPDWQPEGIRLLEPLGYLEMLSLQQAAALVLTDSGGVQKEAFYLGVPCLTLRKETEWMETVHSGWNRLVGDRPQDLLTLAQQILAQPPAGPPPPLYGDGTASRMIADILAAR
ncbi:MAG: non-hydrolyzing UDP-N-acetylglucosamine 2-epimerase [Candidatus Sericytochromatia bacterium]